MAKTKTIRGRPPKQAHDKLVLRNTRILPGVDFAIREIAATEGVTQGEIIRTFIDTGLTFYRQSHNGSKTKYAALGST